MANIETKQIIAGNAAKFTAAIRWTDLDDINTWEVDYKFIDANDNVIKEGTQPVPLVALANAGMNMTIANNIRAWVALQAGITLV